MKQNLLILFLIGILVNSCAIKSIHYNYNFTTFHKGIDFTKQQEDWLLNVINLPVESQQKIQNEFNKWTKNKTTLISKMTDRKGASAGGFFSNPVTLENLDFIKQTTNYKFLVNVYLLKDTKSTQQTTVNELAFEIVDIKTKQLILNEIVIASMDNENTTDIGSIHGVRFTVEPNIINGLVKKGLNKIEENSIY